MKRKKRKPKRLKNINILEISLVSSPANMMPFSELSVFKSSEVQSLCKDLSEWIATTFDITDENIDDIARIAARETTKELVPFIKNAKAPILKDTDKQVLSAVVYVADTPDGDGEYITWDDLQEAAQAYMFTTFKNKRSGIRLEHQGDYLDKAFIVESFLAEKSFSRDGVKFPGKSWFASIYVDDTKLWQKVKNNEGIDGLSLGGFSE